jgi:hypothetical protein
MGSEESKKRRLPTLPGLREAGGVACFACHPRLKGAKEDKGAKNTGGKWVMFTAWGVPG